MNSDLKAVRQFLTSLREEEPARQAPRMTPTRGLVPLHNGIARARMRSAAKPVA